MGWLRARGSTKGKTQSRGVFIRRIPSCTKKQDVPLSQGGHPAFGYISAFLPYITLSVEKEPAFLGSQDPLSWFEPESSAGIGGEQ